MSLITCDDWTEASIGESYYEWAPTSDPRVLALIVRDPYAEISSLYDGDAINPILYRERGSAHWVAGYEGDEASRINRAFEQFDSETAERYLWIFHGLVFQSATDPGDRSGEYLVVTSTDYLKHVGNEPAATKQEAIEDTVAIRTDLQDALDGDVYGIGQAVNRARRLHDDEEIDIVDGTWDLDIEVWGFVGEKYAKSSAAAFEYGEPSLPEMIEVPA